MRATRHNGRSGKHGVYNPKHNDRKFDIANSEHIDAEREKQNIYWDCYRGYVQNPSDETLRNWGPVEPEASFHDIEKMYYEDHYSDFIKGQNARNEKNRHPERNRTTEDLLKNKMTCPEETIFQIGKEGEHISGEQLFHIADFFMKRFEGMFGDHVHILDFALHMDETTPHIHERHVFDCENKYGELCPQQEKALEALGIPLPDPDKPRGRNNNRKMTFDLICRNLLFDVCRQYGLEIEEAPEYGGKKYLEKQEFIIQAQKEKIVAVISPSLLMGYALLGMIGFSLNAIAGLRKESSTKWSKYKLTAPVKRSDIVKSYFISQILWLIVGIAYAGIGVALSIMLHGVTLDRNVDIFMLFVVGIGISLFMGAIFFPLFYLGGEERNEVFLIISLLCGIGIVMGLSTLINTLFPKMTAPQLICGGIAILACSLLVYVLSYPLTVSIFKKKEY